MEGWSHDEGRDGKDEGEEDEDHVLTELGDEGVHEKGHLVRGKEDLDLTGNFPGHKKYEQSDWKCQACDQQVRKDQEDVTHCEGYVDLKEDADLTKEEELVQFFLKVMERRHEMNWD